MVTVIIIAARVEVHFLLFVLRVPRAVVRTVIPDMSRTATADVSKAAAAARLRHVRTIWLLRRQYVRPIRNVLTVIISVRVVGQINNMLMPMANV